MEPNESSGVSCYYNTYHANNPTTPFPTAAEAANVSPTNGILPNAANCHPTAAAAPNAAAPHVEYPASVPPAMPPALGNMKKKRGRPRKYLTPEQARGMSSDALASLTPSAKRDQAALGGGGGQAFSSSQRKSQSAALGESRKGFTPHTINVVAGEDVGQKIMVFMQQRKSDICIISAIGSISVACLRQSAPSGGNTTYEGKFKILSLTGSFIHHGRGVRTGGICISLAYSDGQIIGGGVGGPLIAAGPTQVVVATFFVDPKQIFYGGIRDETSAQIGRAPVPSFGFQSMADSSHLSFEGSHFMMQLQCMESTPLYATECRGSTVQAMHQSPENGDLEHLGD